MAVETRSNGGGDQKKAQAGALPPSTQDALGKLAAAAAAATAVGAVSSGSKQQQQQSGNGSGTCRVQTAEELTDAVEVCTYVLYLVGLPTGGR
jgi:hypothetical protein